MKILLFFIIIFYNISAFSFSKDTGCCNCASAKDCMQISKLKHPAVAMFRIERNVIGYLICLIPLSFKVIRCKKESLSFPPNSDL